MAGNLDKSSAKEFFTVLVPKLFAEGAKQVDASGLAGTEFTLQFNIVGSGGGNYCLKIKDGKNLEVIEGGIAKPNLGIELSEGDWREAVTGAVPGVMDQFMNPKQAASRSMMDNAKGINGAFNLELTRAGKPSYGIKMLFNGVSQPFASLKMDLGDYFKMVKKEVDGPGLFMSGKMAFEGDMAFLLQLQGVMG